MVNTPIPHSLRSEAKKAAKILRGFTVPTANFGPDKLIPAGILLKAKGLAILTVVKAGFLVTARAGSGIVIAKVGDDIDAEWSAPSAIGIAGLGGGFEIGAEVTDFVIILNSRGAVEAFSKGGNLTLGGNFSIAAGPIGRSIEADIAVRSPAAIYTYSKTKGLFAGISVEGSALIERKDANKKFYGQDIRAFQILTGAVPRPDECSLLYDVLEMHRTNAEKQLMGMAKKAAMKQVHGAGEKIKDRFSNKTKSKSEWYNCDPGEEDSMAKYSLPKSGYHDDSSGDKDSMSKYNMPKSRSNYNLTDNTSSNHDPMTKYDMPKSRSNYNLTDNTSSSIDPMSKYDLPRAQSCHSIHSVSQQSNSSAGSKTVVRRTVKTHTTRTSSKGAAAPHDPWAKVDIVSKKAVANFAYSAQLPCDLSFKEGEEILVLMQTSSANDWWEGVCRGRTGIFPANYVTVR